VEPSCKYVPCLSNSESFGFSLICEESVYEDCNVFSSCHSGFSDLLTVCVYMWFSFSLYVLYRKVVAMTQILDQHPHIAAIAPKVAKVASSLILWLHKERTLK
jgi:hypothetical protein